MKTFNVTNRLSAQARKEIERIIETNQKYSNSYFWRPDSSASGRRSKEKKFREFNPDVTFVKSGKTIKVHMTYQESCKNCYYQCLITVNDEIKDIRAVKALLHK